MFKEILKKIYSNIPIIVLIITFILFLLAFSVFHDLLNNLKTRPKLTEQDYYNKFCTKHFDVSCDNINLK